MTKAKPHTETITIQKRWSWLTALSVEVECDPTLSPRIKLGLALKVAHEAKQGLTGADLRDAVLRDAVLTGADLMDAVLRGADLTGAVLRDAVLTDAVLRGADLTGADLTGAVLRGADLRGADLTGAVLRGADLRGADLTGADLTGAVLRGADLRGEKIERIFAIAGRLDGYTFYGIQLRTGGVKISAGCRWYTIEQFREHVAKKYPDTDKARETLDIIEFIEKRAVGLPAPVVEAVTETVAS